MDGEAWQDSSIFRHPSYPKMSNLVRRQSGQVFTFEKDPALRRVYHSHNTFERGGFTDPVSAQ